MIINNSKGVFSMEPLVQEPKSEFTANTPLTYFFLALIMLTLN